MLVDASAEEPPGNVVAKIELLRRDTVADVRAAAAAVTQKIARLSGGAAAAGS